MPYAQILAAGAVAAAWWAGLSTEVVGVLTGATALLVLVGKEFER